MIAFWSRGGSTDLVELIDSLIDASRIDPYLMELYGSPSHSDGWGYALYIHRDKGSLIHSKSLNPIYNTIEYTRLTGLARLIKDADYAVGFMHSRHASKNTPTGLLAVHPFHLVAADGSLVIVAHNGSVNTGKLLEVLGRAPGYPEMYPDSYLAALYIASKPDDIPGAFRELEDYAKTALNLAVLRLRESGQNYSEAELYVYTYLSPEYRDKNKYNAYYRMYLAMNRDVRAVVSSTVAERLEEQGWSIHDLSVNGDGFHIYYRDGRFKSSKIP